MPSLRLLGSHTVCENSRCNRTEAEYRTKHRQAYQDEQETRWILSIIVFGSLHLPVDVFLEVEI